MRSMDINRINAILEVIHRCYDDLGHPYDVPVNKLTMKPGVPSRIFEQRVRKIERSQKALARWIAEGLEQHAHVKKRRR